MKEAAKGPANVQGTIKLVSEQSLPLEVGILEVDDEGRLSPRDGDKPVCFSFEYAGVPFEAEVKAGEGPLVKVTAQLGALPYTVESPEARRWALRVIEATCRMKRGRLELGPRMEIRLRAEAVPPAPRTPAAVLATVTALLLDFKPCLALLREVLARGLARPAAARSTVS